VSEPTDRGGPSEHWLARHPALVPPVSTAGAAVVIVLREVTDDVEVLLIERATNPQDPASGQVALPGGRVDDDDNSLAVTALRELEEEVGLTEGDLDGSLRFVGAPVARRFGLKVGVFAAKLADRGRGPTVRSAAEVAHVFWLPRAALLTSRAVERETSRGLAPVRATVHEGHVLWGFTRRILREFFELPEEDDLVGPMFAESSATGRPS